MPNTGLWADDVGKKIWWSVAIILCDWINYCDDANNKRLAVTKLMVSVSRELGKIVNRRAKRDGVAERREIRDADIIIH